MEPIIRSNQRWLTPVTVLASSVALLSGLLMSFLIISGIAETERARLEAVYNVTFNQAVAAVITKLQAYEEVLRATQGLFYVSPDLSREDFTAFYQSLKLEEKYPGILGLGYVVLLEPAQQAEHIRAVRRLGLTDYAIFPANERDIYSSTLYIEPLTERNRNVLGFDMYSDPARKEAMDRAAESGQIALTEKTSLVQGDAKETSDGVLMYLPVLIDPSESGVPVEQRTLPSGWIHVVFRLDDLLHDVLQAHSRVGALTIYDESSDRADNVLFSRPGDTSALSISLQKSYEIGGRTWSFIGQPDSAFVDTMSSSNVTVSWLVGGTLSLLLALVIAAVTNGRLNTVRKTTQLAKSYRQNSRRLALATEAAQIAIWEWDTETNEVVFNSMASTVFGVKLDNNRLDYAEFEKLIHEADLMAFRIAIEQALQHHSPVDLRFRVYHGTSIKMLKTSAELYFNDAGQTVSLIGISYDITEDWQHQKHIAETEQRWKHALEGSGAGVWDWQVADDIVLFSDKLLALLGYYPGEIPAKMTQWLKLLVHPEDVERVTTDINRIVNDEILEYRNEHRLQAKDGTWIWVLGHATVVERDTHNNALRVIGTNIDVSWRKQAELALQQSEERFRNAFGTAAVGMAIIGLDGRWLEVNTAICRMLGYTEQELLSKTFFDITHPDDLDLDLKFIKKLLDGELEHYQIEKRYFHKSGEIIFVLLSVSPVRNETGEVIHFVSQVEDITTRKVEAERIRKMAYHDTLTGLPNRRLFDESISHALAHAKRVGYPVALMFVDVDHFKKINDTHGHDVGDEILKAVAERMKHCLRQTDTLSRVGGDEFIVLLTEIKQPGDAKVVAEHILQTVSQPLLVHTHNFQVTLSIGVAIYDGESEMETVSGLTKKADMALYEVKTAGRNGVHVFGSNHLHNSVEAAGAAGN